MDVQDVETRLRPLLMSAGGPDKVMVVVERLFQRAPAIVQELRDTAREAEDRAQGGQKKSVKKSTLVDVVCEKIEWLCSDLNNSKMFGMPGKVSAYVSFAELVLATIWESRKEWSVFLLEDYPTRNKDPEPIDEEGYILRTKLKKEIKSMGFAADVQTEAIDSRIWFRIACVKKMKDGIKTSQALEVRKPTFAVYYPGEPYFYSSKSAPDIVRSALASSLGCEGVRLLQLNGSDIASLRRIRLSRDARVRDSGNDMTETDRFTVFDQVQRDNEGSEGTQHPILDKVTLHMSKQLEDVGINLNCRMDIVGADLIGGLNDMMDEGIIDSDPAPAWITNLATAGRNNFKLKSQEQGPGSVLGGGPERAWDQESVLSRAAWL